MATWSKIQSKSSGGVGLTELTFSANPIVGNLVICAATKFNGTLSGVTDNGSGGSNTYTKAIGDFVGAKSADIEIWYCFITKTATPLTVTIGSHSFSSIAIAEFACTGTSQAADATASADGHTAAAAPGNIAVAATDLILVGVYNGDTVTAPAGYAVLENVPNVPSTDLGLCVLYKLDSTTNPETCSATLGSVNDWIAIGASFKATPAVTPCHGAALLPAM